LWNRPLTQEVTDGTGTRLAYSTIEYDNYTEAITSSGATQLVACSGSACTARGNQTAVSHWRNGDGAMLTARSQFDDAGNVRKVTDPLGHSITFSFADNWTGGNSTCAPASGAAAAYPTVVTNHLGHQAVSTYNSCNGTIATQKDPNLQTTTTTYDALNRPLTVTRPDGGFTQSAYPSPTHTTVQLKPAFGVTDTNLWPTTETYLDGLGRTSQVASKNGESRSGWDVKTTCYDSRGYATFSSYPAQVSSMPVESPCSLPGDTLQIDALGRVTQVAHSDGSTVLTDYLGRATRVQDEGKDNSGNRVTRVTQVDGLGRLTSVCEKSSANQMGSNNTPAACGQDIAATGFLTSYQYDIHDTAGNAMQVNQAGLASRYFVYDSLGNLLSAANPESGTTKYTYNDDGTLHTRIRPKPNQTNPNVVVTTTYTYDAIHRLKQTDYDDNSTASVFMLYDQASATTGQALANGVGRLTTVSAAGGQSVNLYSYDPTGRVASNWQCTPAQNCATGMKQLAYGYDLLGNTTSASNGFGVNVGYAYNIASRLQSATSSLVDATHPAALLSGLTYGPFGLTGATLGNGVNESRGYTGRGQLSSISDTVTVTQPAVPGSGSVTISGSERSIGGPPATSASGSVTLSGSIQSTQVVNQPAAAGSGTVNVSGTEQSTQVQSSPGTPGQGSVTVSGTALRGYDDAECGCYIYDSGTISVWVNGARIDTSYSQATSATQVAASIAGQIACCSNVVTASNSDGLVTITARTNHANTFYSVSVSQSSNRPDVFPSGSFTISWTNVTGGSDPTYTTLYDTGTVTATANGFSKSASYGQGSTSATVASALASAFHNDGSSPVDGSASGASLTLTSRATGAGTNYTLSASSSTSQGAYFSQPSFTASATSSTLLGGHDATYNTLYDSGTVSITVNGITKSTSYSQNSTLAGLATSLASAFNGDSAAPVNASASGAIVTLTTRATGASTNYALGAGSSTSQGTYFSSPSFSGSASGATLTGGQNAGAPVNDTGTVSITVNGFTKSTSYNATSTASSVASALGTAFAGDTNSPVNATVSSGTITLTSKTAGASTNYALSVSSATNQTGFTGTSFPASGSGANLTGGADSTQTPTTPYSVALTFMPNGDVATANDNVNGNWTYAYDGFNRLASSSKTGASYTYAYDRYGNRWQQNGPNSSILTFSSGNNRADQFSYDAAGNQLNDGQGHSFTYDAENRIITVGSNVSYIYDGAGQRIRKTVTGTSTDFLYDLADHIVVEMDSSAGWNRGEVFAGAVHVATYANSSTYFAHSDWLGTERSRTQVNGQICETISSLPFGDGATTSGSCYPSPILFTGKERDVETGLDYFGARYYSSGLGRFITPDWAAKPAAVPYAALGDPQSLNLYMYVRNIPTSQIDRDGHCPPCTSEDWANGRIWTDPATGIAVDLGDPEGNIRAAQMAMSAASVVPVINLMTLPLNVGLSAMTGHKGEAALAVLSAIPGEKVAASVWKLGNFARGIAIETALGKNLAAGFPVIDKFLNGTATSIKSIDLTAKSYQDTEKLAGTLENYVDKVSNFNGATYGKEVVKGSDIAARELQVAIPKGSMSAAQQKVFDAAAARAANLKNPVKLTVTQVQ
jgi:RHS repeat-associated protein